MIAMNISCEKLVKMEELHEAALKILYYFQNIPKSEKVEYISPIIHKYNLSDNQTNGQHIRQLKKFIAKNVVINKNITSYVARHSFATYLKFNGVSETVISELMVHSDVLVTKSYLQKFGSYVLDDALNKLN